MGRLNEAPKVFDRIIVSEIPKYFMVEGDYDKIKTIVSFEKIDYLQYLKESSTMVVHFSNHKLNIGSVTTEWAKSLEEGYITYLNSK